jgi:hypothetical protein
MLNNFSVTPILNNDNFWQKIQGNKIIPDTLFFRNFYPASNEVTVKKLCWTDITNLVTGNLLSINQLRTVLGDSERREEGYRYLTKTFNTAKTNFKSVMLPSVPFHDFMTGKTKGSKIFRRIMMRAEDVIRKKQPKNPINNFFRIAGQDLIGEDVMRINLQQINSLWTVHFLQSDFRTFLFKLYHNILGLNSRVAHINPQRDPSCFFCLKSGNLPAELESFSHFFWHCPTTQGLIKKFFDSYLTIECSFSAMHLGCYTEENKHKFSVPLAIIGGLFKFVLWNFKLRKRLPTWPSVVSDFFFIFSSMLGASRKFEGEVNRCNLFKRSTEEN